MTAFTDFQNSLVLILGLAALACEVFALVDALHTGPTPSWRPASAPRTSG